MNKRETSYLRCYPRWLDLPPSIYFNLMIPVWRLQGCTFLSLSLSFPPAWGCGPTPLPHLDPALGCHSLFNLAASVWHAQLWTPFSCFGGLVLSRSRLISVPCAIFMVWNILCLPVFYFQLLLKLWCHCYFFFSPLLIFNSWSNVPLRKSPPPRVLSQTSAHDSDLFT